MAGLIRFRAAARDRMTDEVRHQGLRQRITGILEEIDRETQGLSRRLSEARGRAASIMGNEDGIYYQREPRLETLLREAERQMAVADNRLKALAAERRKYEFVQNALESPVASDPLID